LDKCLFSRFTGIVKVLDIFVFVHVVTLKWRENHFHMLALFIQVLNSHQHLTCLCDHACFGLGSFILLLLETTLLLFNSLLVFLSLGLKVTHFHSLGW
jgi:hypothetical protein